MVMRVFSLRLVVVLLAVALVAPPLTATGVTGMTEETGLEEPYVPYVPTPAEVVEEMLEIAYVSSQDLVYDLGSGDGRFVIAAAKHFGARSVGIEIDPERVREARKSASLAGVTDLVRFVQGDFFAADLREASVVTPYLLPEVNRLLSPSSSTNSDPAPGSFPGRTIWATGLRKRPSGSAGAPCTIGSFRREHGGGRTISNRELPREVNGLMT
jgi:hypothetical protein